MRKLLWTAHVLVLLTIVLGAWAYAEAERGRREHARCLETNWAGFMTGFACMGYVFAGLEQKLAAMLTGTLALLCYAWPPARRWWAGRHERRMRAELARIDRELAEGEG